MPTIVTIVGARPQFVKAGAISRVIGQVDDLNEVMVHTGQHYDDNMSAIFFRELEIPEPRYNLGINAAGHGAMTGQMLEQIEQVLVEIKPDAVLVYGDTNSTLAGALAASKLHLPVAHVEAGLRSYNRRMPEEVNRVLTDHVSTILFCPTQQSIANLAKEGISRNVLHTGDVMFDATVFAKRAALKHSAVLENLGLADGGYSLCTIHRAENTDDPEQLRRVCSYLEARAAEAPLVMPLHPRAAAALARFEFAIPGAVIIDPVGYFDMHRLLAGAERVFTDSGGLQKEAYFHGKPCVTLRDETEWVETVTHGWNQLWQQPKSNVERQPITDYGDGTSAERTIEVLLTYLR